MDPEPSNWSSLLYVVDIWLCQAKSRREIFGQHHRLRFPVCGDIGWVSSHMVRSVGSRHIFVCERPLFLSGSPKVQAHRHHIERGIGRFLHPQGLSPHQNLASSHRAQHRRSRNPWHDASTIRDMEEREKSWLSIVSAKVMITSMSHVVEV